MQWQRSKKDVCRALLDSRCAGGGIVETLRLIRNIFIRSFVIGAGLGLVFAIATLAGWNVWMPLGARLFHTDAATVTSVTLQFFVGLRFFLWFCVLTPALAMHWTLKAETKNSR